jgi:hypothetical protein
MLETEIRSWVFVLKNNYFVGSRICATLLQPQQYVSRRTPGFFCATALYNRDDKIGFSTLGHCWLLLLRGDCGLISPSQIVLFPDERYLDLDENQFVALPISLSWQHLVMFATG